MISSERDWAGLETEILAVRLETQESEGSQDEIGIQVAKHAATVSTCKHQGSTNTKHKNKHEATVDQQVSRFLISKRG